MAAEFHDPHEELEELLPQLDVDVPDTEALTAASEPAVDDPSDAMLADAATQLHFDEISAPPNVDQFGPTSIAMGKEPIGPLVGQHAFARGASAPADEPSLALGRHGEGDKQRPLDSHQAESFALYSTSQQASPQRPAEVPPVVVHHRPPQIESVKPTGKENRERLRIEVEVTLTNAERITRIAVEEAHAEFKKLASQATQRLDEKFYEYRANQRLLWRG